MKDIQAPPAILLESAPIGAPTGESSNEGKPSRRGMRLVALYATAATLGAGVGRMGAEYAMGSDETPIANEEVTSPTTDSHEDTSVSLENEGEVDCSKLDISLPTLLDAVAAKEAVNNIEFFIEDPYQVDQVRSAIRASTSNTEIEQIMSAVFAPRGIELLFNQTPAGVNSNPDVIDLENYKVIMSNMLDAYARMPAKIAMLSSKVYLANTLATNSDNNGNGTIDDGETTWAGGLAYSTGEVAFDLNSFRDYRWGVTVVAHELGHQADNQTCAPGIATDQDAAYDTLRKASELTSTDAGYDPQVYGAHTDDPEYMNELQKVVSEPYGLANMAEDKATVIADATIGNYPDATDANFDTESIIYKKQAVLIDRLATQLNMPELPQLLIFNDIYGITSHPNRIIELGLSPYQSELIARIESTMTQENITFDEAMANIRSTQVILPDGTTDTLYYYDGATLRGYDDLPLNIDVLSDGISDCNELPEVVSLKQYAEAVIGGVTTIEGAYISSDAQALNYDQETGKMSCSVVGYATMSK